MGGQLHEPALEHGALLGREQPLFGEHQHVGLAGPDHRGVELALMVLEHRQEMVLLVDGQVGRAHGVLLEALLWGGSGSGASIHAVISSARRVAAIFLTVPARSLVTRDTWPDQPCQGVGADSTST